MITLGNFTFTKKTIKSRLSEGEGGEGGGARAHACMSKYFNEGINYIKKTWKTEKCNAAQMYTENSSRRK